MMMKKSEISMLLMLHFFSSFFLFCPQRNIPTITQTYRNKNSFNTDKSDFCGRKSMRAAISYDIDM